MQEKEDFIVKKKIRIHVAWQEYREIGFWRFLCKYLLPYGIYLMTAAAVVLNGSLIFDNVLWGDECFSANTARKSLGGILQVLYFWDNHPPLHYYWTKLFGEMLGHTGWVYHLAALTPFLAGLVLALVCLQKHFEKIPVSFLIVITALAPSCVHNNLEIRMYSLAFLGVLCSYYCAYRVICGGKSAAWIGMVFWALVGAYSHYYAMMTAGILIFVTGVAVIVRFGSKTWIKSLAALAAYVVGYAPWFSYLFHGTGSVKNSWWMTELMGLKDSAKMILCGPEFAKSLFLLLVVCMAVLFLAESSFFEIKQDKAETPVIVIHRPSLKRWSDHAYGAAIGIFTILGTIIAVYLVCMIVGPVLTGRYLYPVSAITVLLVVIGSDGMLKIVRQNDVKCRIKWPENLVKLGLVFILTALVVIGLRGYREYRKEAIYEKEVTEQTLDIIGEVSEDTVLMSHNVKHLAWTVLYYYYPEREIVTGRCSEEGTEYDKLWYFSPEEVEQPEIDDMRGRGYEVEYYGEQQIATYPFYLYHFVRASGS